MVRRVLVRHWCFVVGRTPPLPVPTSCFALFLVLSSLLFVLVLTFTGSSMVVVCGVGACSEKDRFSTFCMVSVAHGFFNGMGASFLLTCLVVGILGAGVCEVFALFSVSSFFGQSQLVVTCPCPQFTHL